MFQLPVLFGCYDFQVYHKYPSGASEAKIPSLSQVSVPLQPKCSCKETSLNSGQDGDRLQVE